MLYRANKNTSVKLVNGEYYLVKDWEVVELKLEHSGYVIGRFDKYDFYMQDYLFFEDFDKIPDRIEVS